RSARRLAPRPASERAWSSPRRSSDWRRRYTVARPPSAAISCASAYACCPGDARTRRSSRRSSVVSSMRTQEVAYSTIYPPAAPADAMPARWSFEAHVDAPPDAVYAWMTDYSEDDHANERFRRGAGAKADDRTHNHRVVER